MRCDLEQDMPLATGQECNSQVVSFEIAETTMYQARRATTASGAKIFSFYKSGTEAAHRSVPRDPSSGDSTSDYQHVDGGFGHRLEVGDPAGERKGGVHAPILV
jgi:hypothetical protein